MLHTPVRDRLEQFRQISAAAGYPYHRLAWRMQNLFDGVDWRGKRICEIGCGEGLMSLYLALNGAESVVGLDPEAKGAQRGRMARLEGHVAALGVDNFAYIPDFFSASHFAPNSLDILFSVNVIEHIHETKLPLHRDPTATEAYERFFGEMLTVLKPGGGVIIANCSRYSLWALVSEATHYRLKTPIRAMHGVYWALHQSPGTWARLARGAGFGRTRIHWRVPHQLRRAGWLADNPLFQYVTFADYMVKAWKPA
jgi:SAM-dependent methyltransferase